jgi:hypothetical protein
MILPAFVSLMIAAGSTEVTLLRLEPSTALEREALDAIRADGTVTWSDASVDRTLSQEEQRLAMSGFWGAGKVLVWVVSFDDAIEVHTITGAAEERVRKLSLQSGMSAASTSENVAALVRSQLILLNERNPPAQTDKPTPPASVEQPPQATQAVAPTPTSAAQQARFRLGLGYAGGSLGTPLGYQNGAQLSAQVLWGLFHTTVRIDVFASVPVKTAAADFNVARQAASLTAGPGKSVGHWRFGAEAGVGAERIERNSLRSALGTPAAQRAYLLPSLVVDASIGLGQLLGPFGVELMVRAQVPVRTLEFVSNAGETLASTAPVRIGASLSVVFER